MPFIKIESEIIDKDEMGVSFVDRNEVKLVVRYSVPSINIEESLVLNVTEN